MSFKRPGWVSAPLRNGLESRPRYKVVGKILAVPSGAKPEFSIGKMKKKDDGIKDDSQTEDDKDRSSRW